MIMLIADHKHAVGLHYVIQRKLCNIRRHQKGFLGYQNTHCVWGRASG